MAQVTVGTVVRKTTHAGTVGSHTQSSATRVTMSDTSPNHVPIRNTRGTATKIVPSRSVLLATVLILITMVPK